MAATIPVIPNVDAPDKPEEITLKPALIMHADGSQETVYIQDIEEPLKQHLSAHKVHKHLTIIYLVVGTIALTLSVVATIITIKNKG